jgi:hypothetical protein
MSYLLVVETDYILIYRFVSVMLGPNSLMGGCGMLSPTKLFPGGSRGGNKNFCSTPGRVLRGNTHEAKYWENIPCKIL